VNRSIGVLFISVILPYLNSAAEPQPPDPAAIVEKAVANYRARGDHRKNYTYVEEVGKQWFSGPPDFNGYENIFVNGKPYRRHVKFNGQSIRPEDEQAERQKIFEAGWRYVPRGYRVSSKGLEKADEDFSVVSRDPQLASLKGSQDNIRAFRKRFGLTNNPCSAAFPKHLQELQLPIEDFDQAFEFRNSKAEVLEGRSTWVFDGFPISASSKLAKEALNFQVRIWIDKEDLEIAKIEATAIREGLLSSADHYTLEFIKNPSEALVATIQKSLESTKLTYASDTKFVIEWRKFNNEVWLPVYSSISGTEITMAPICERKKVKFMTLRAPFVSETVFSDYKKFRAQTRILTPE
jgi:hypothetical protein